MVCPWGSNTEGFSVTNTLAFMTLLIRRLWLPAEAGSYETFDRPLGYPWLPALAGSHHARAEDPREDRVDVAHLLVQVERLLDLHRRQHLHQVLVGEQQRLEVLLLVERPHRVPLHPLVGLFPR